MADRIIASSAPEWRDAAREMLAASLPDATIEPEGDDLLAIAAEGLSIADVAEIVRGDRIPFVRHLFREVGQVTLFGRQPVGGAVDAIVDTLLALPVPLPPMASLQVWASGTVETIFRPDELRRELETSLSETGFRIERAGMPQVLSACIVGDHVLLGLNGVASALSDWPGGRVRLAKPSGQVSRSEFKLEEIFRTTDLPLPHGGIALDLGASPGGWTRILRGHGFEVVAVDPADLDSRLRRDAGIRHVRSTAAPYLAESRRAFDLIVNDMRMDPAMSVGLMVEASRHLKPGGVMIVTLKLSRHGAVAAVRAALARLDTVVEVELARQLHHNRDEVTVVGRKPA